MLAHVGALLCVLCPAEGHQEQTRASLQVGIRPGQQLLSISDPIRNDEVWKISIETKLSRVRDALQYRSPPTINLQLTESSIEDEAGFVWG